MMYEGIIAAWTALNNTIRRRRRTFTVQKEHILVAESNQVLRSIWWMSFATGTTGQSKPVMALKQCALAARCRRQIHLLMTVVRLPDLIGWELAELLRFDHPDVAVVCIAHDREDWRRFGRKNLKCILLQVPFRAEVALEVVRQELSRSAGLHQRPGEDSRKGRCIEIGRSMPKVVPAHLGIRSSVQELAR